MGQVHLGWAKLSWIVHGVFNPWILGNDRSWVLGFNPNPPYYIKRSLVLELALVCVRNKGGPILASIIFSQVFPSCFGVICDTT